MKHSIPVTERSAIAECRRAARIWAEASDLPRERCDAVAIVASEAATNLLRHAEQGRLYLQRVPGREGPWLLLAAVDKGPGIEDVDAALCDGQSTAGSAGTGLGAMRRLSDRFDIYSTPRGTTVTCEFGSGPRAMAGVELGAFLRNHPGETACGDGWAARSRGGVFELMVVDGLGHGPRAAAAAREALEAFEGTRAEDPGEVLVDLSEQLLGSRGSVTGLARIESADGTLRYAGIGNISAAILSPTGALKRLVGATGGWAARSAAA